MVAPQPKLCSFCGGRGDGAGDAGAPPHEAHERGDVPDPDPLFGLRTVDSNVVGLDVRNCGVFNGATTMRRTDGALAAQRGQR